MTNADAEVCAYLFRSGPLDVCSYKNQVHLTKVVCSSVYTHCKSIIWKHIFIYWVSDLLTIDACRHLLHLITLPILHMFGFRFGWYIFSFTVKQIHMYLLSVSLFSFIHMSQFWSNSQLPQVWSGNLRPAVHKHWAWTSQWSKKHLVSSCQTFKIKYILHVYRLCIFQYI